MLPETVYDSVCVCCSIGDNVIKSTIIKLCFFLIRYLYSVVSLTLVKE